ncbi:MAG: hypothetical protein ACYS9X_03125 [Planctomycetota bacterium]|jgi:outer membrane protein assembly factor BamB
MKRSALITAAVAALCIGAGVLVMWGLSPAERGPQPETGAAGAMQPATPRAAGGEISDPTEAATSPSEPYVPELQVPTTEEDERPAQRSDAPPRKTKRLIWEVRTGGGKDCFLELTPAGDKLLAMRKGVLYGFDVETGEEAWRFPREGRATGFEDPRYSRYAPYILGVVDGHAITRVPDEGARYGSGVLAIRLDDGEVAREFRPELGFPHRRSRWKQLDGTRIAFWALNEERTRTEVVVVDLVKWCEIARFELPTVSGDLHVFEGRVHGLLRREQESFYRAFTLDLERAQLYSCPLRKGWSVPLKFALLPDGSRVFAQGRISARCGFEGPWPHWGKVYVTAGGVYGRDHRGFYRAGPVDGRVLWRLGLGPSRPYRWSIGASANLAAIMDSGWIYIVEAETGRLLAAIRTRHDLSRIHTELACDDRHVYHSDPTGLRAYSTWPVDAEKPDSDDPGDPACVLARCREALANGDFARALGLLKGVGPSIPLRPSVREEVAALLSQLRRSPAATLHPELWEKLMLSDGWVAGELFIDDYKRLGAAGPLLAIGTHPSLLAASKIAGQRGADPHSAFLAAEAEEILTGRRPLEKHLAHGSRHAEVALRLPMDDETFARLLPELREHDLKRLRLYAGALSPGQVLQLFGSDKAIADVAKLQVELQARGVGEKEQIRIDKMGTAPPPEQKDGF